MLLPSAIPHPPRPPLQRQKSYSAHAQLFSSSTNNYLQHTTILHPSFVVDPMTAETNVQKASRAVREILDIQTPRRSTVVDALPAQRCLQKTSANSRLSTTGHRAPRSMLKRRRNIWEDDCDDGDRKDAQQIRNKEPRRGRREETDTPMATDDQENAFSLPLPTIIRFQTPKRIRHVPPPIVPLGLIPEDFENLQTSSALMVTFPKPTTTTIILTDKADSNMEDQDHTPPSPFSPSQASETQKQAWTPSEDEFLLSLLLSKFSTGFSHQEWEDCARTLGRDGRLLRRRGAELLEELGRRGP
ncbi:MAG: hypothetical protein MMC33_006125 [Icmadophila ericetorum]|nr:hypothetical protein [Icmadophila ericetorum]